MTEWSLSAVSRRRVAAVIAALALSAVAISSAQASKPGRNASAKRSAQSAASQLLGAFRAPPGAVRSATDPGSSAFLSHPAQRPATPNLVDRHRFWQVPGPTDEALHWVSTHLLAGAHQEINGGTGTSAGQSSFFVGYGLPAGNRKLASRELLVTVVSTHTGTAMRVDAQVIWLTTRPASERIPAGASAVRVVAQGLGTAPVTVKTVTHAASVARIVTLVDALPAAQPGAYSCPADIGPTVSLSFVGGGSPKPRTLAKATADGSGCGGVSLSIDGRAQPGLSGGPRLIRQLNALLGLSLG